MRNTLRAAGIAPLVALALFASAHAQSSASLQAQLDALLAQLAALQAQLQVQTGDTASPPATSSGACPALYRSLRQGLSGDDVASLQRYLASDPTIYPEGTVSGYFGALTERAVQRFQGAHGIVSSGGPDSTGYGAVGPATRAAIANSCAGGPSVPGATCVLNGVAAASGATADFYSVSVSPAGTACSAYKQTRQCINGVFSGNAAYQYASCSDGASLTCRVNGITIANGASSTFFSVPSVGAGNSCSSYAQIRTCTNGTLSGSSNFIYGSCATDTPDSCSVNGITIAHGQSRTFYKQDFATSTNSCSAQAQTRTCNDGVLSGDGAYSKTSCTAGACQVGGLTLPSGSSTKLYFAQHIPASEQCGSYAQTRTCTNGALSGSAVYQYASCAPVSGGACALDNVVLASGASTSFYSVASAPAGKSCGAYRTTRTCTNGVLSGNAAYNRASCTDTSSCTLDGATVAHGSSGVFYSSKTVNFGSTCSGASQTRTCTNGTLSGSATYQYASCSVNPPTALRGSAQLAAALTALESILLAALDQLDGWF